MTAAALLERVQGWPELTDDESIGFRSPEAVAASLAWFPAVDAGRRQYVNPIGRERLPGESVTDQAPIERVLKVGPGLVTVRVSDPRSKDGPRDLQQAEWRQGELFPDEPEGDLDDLDDFDSCGDGGVVAEFSRKSKARLGRAVASIDFYTPLKATPGSKIVHITLTYPGDWETVCPDPATLKAHLDAFARRYLRAFGVKLHCVWKREFQRRGAPHLHLLVVTEGRTLAGHGLHRWVSRAWFDVVGSGDRRHLRAGTRCDWAQGLRMSDAHRAAAYFSGYTASKDKDYQEVLPYGWRNENGSAGRWWGVRGFKPLTAQVRITATAQIHIRRLMRGALGAQKRTRRQTVKRTSRTTGEIRFRKLRRRYSLSSLDAQRDIGFTYLVNDGPAFVVGLARALALMGDNDDPDPWPAGQPRPLP